jgi:hypothetical protein
MIRFNNVRLVAARYAMGGAVLGGSRSRYDGARGAECSRNAGRVRIGATRKKIVPAADGSERPSPTVQALGQVQLWDVGWSAGALGW